MDISKAYLTVLLDVSAGSVCNEFHSSHQDIRSWIEQQDAEYIGNISDDGSEIERVVYYDSGIESSVHSSSDISDAAAAVIQYQSASSESEKPNSSVEIDEDVYETYYDKYDEEDDWAQGLAFDGGQHHNLNV